MIRSVILPLTALVSLKEKKDEIDGDPGQKWKSLEAVNFFVCDSLEAFLMEGNLLEIGRKWNPKRSW